MQREVIGSKQHHILVRTATGVKLIKANNLTVTIPPICLVGVCSCKHTYFLNDRLLQPIPSIATTARRAFSNKLACSHEMKHLAFELSSRRGGKTPSHESTAGNCG